VFIAFLDKVLKYGVTVRMIPVTLMQNTLHVVLEKLILARQCHFTLLDLVGSSNYFLFTNTKQYKGVMTVWFQKISIPLPQRKFPLGPPSSLDFPFFEVSYVPPIPADFPQFVKHPPPNPSGKFRSSREEC